MQQVNHWLGVSSLLLASATAIAPAIAQGVRQVTAIPSETALELAQTDAAVDDTSDNADAAAGPNATFRQAIPDSELVSALRGGGYVIFFRHVQTERDFIAQPVVSDGLVRPDLGEPISLAECSDRRILSEAGAWDARLIGQAIAELGIPVGEVYTSGYCRALLTANIAFGSYELAPQQVFPNVAVAEGSPPRTSNILPLLTAPPPEGTNVVIVGHADVFDLATERGVEYPLPQGMAYVLEPDGAGNFSVLADLLPRDWSRLPRQVPQQR